VGQLVPYGVVAIGAIFNKKVSNPMSTQLEATRQHSAHQMLERASTAVIYLEILGTFTAITLIGCVIWLLVW
jgi:hypothetical protein